MLRRERVFPFEHRGGGQEGKPRLHKSSSSMHGSQALYPLHFRGWVLPVFLHLASFGHCNLKADGSCVNSTGQIAY